MRAACGRLIGLTHSVQHFDWTARTVFTVRKAHQATACTVGERIQQGCSCVFLPACTANRSLACGTLQHAPTLHTHTHTQRDGPTHACLCFTRYGQPPHAGVHAHAPPLHHTLPLSARATCWRGPALPGSIAMPQGVVRAKGELGHALFFVLIIVAPSHACSVHPVTARACVATTYTWMKYTYTTDSTNCPAWSRLRTRKVPLALPESLSLAVGDTHMCMQR